MGNTVAQCLALQEGCGFNPTSLLRCECECEWMYAFVLLCGPAMNWPFVLGVTLPSPNEQCKFYCGFYLWSLKSKISAHMVSAKFRTLKRKMDVPIKSFRSYMLYVLTMAKAFNDCQRENNVESPCIDSR